MSGEPGSPGEVYSVVWLSIARDRFDRLWTGATEHDQARLGRAMVELDVFLRYDPLGLGEARGGEVPASPPCRGGERGRTGTM